MRRSHSYPLYVLIAITLLSSLVPLASMAQPAPPNPCPDGQFPQNGVCVPLPPTEVPPVEEPPAPPEGDLASFTLFHLACDNDFQADAVRDAGGMGRANGCFTFGKPPFTYSIAANGVPVITASLDATERDFARLDVPSPIPAGTLTITVSPVESYTTELISCGLSIGDGSGEIVEPPIAGGSATLNTLPNQDVECWVYNVTREIEEQDRSGDQVVGSGDLVDVEPGDSQTIDVDTSVGPGADITLTAYYCPAGTTAADDLIATCTQPASDMFFELLTETETISTPTSDAEGDVFFQDAPPNDYGIAANLPSGYGEPIVFCYVADPRGNVVEGQQDVVFGNQIRLRLGDGYLAECAWYNVPAEGQDDGPNVFIQARKCGEGIEITPSMTVFEAEQLCSVVYQNKEFQVQLDGQVLATKKTNDDPLSSGQVFFTKLPAPNGGGIYGITTTLDEGEQTLGVFCDQNFGAEVFHTVTTMVTNGNRIDHELLEGWTLRCSWFIKVNPLVGGTQTATEPALDPTSEAATAAALQGTLPPPPQLDPTSEAATAAAIPPEPGITILARLCPPEVVEQRIDLDVACFVPGTGITFDVSVDGVPSSAQTTGPNGEIDIPVGAGPATYLLRNQPKAGHSDPEVTCTITHADRTTDQVGGFLSADLPGQEIAFDGTSAVVCTFYFLIDPSQLDVSDDALEVDEPPPPEGQAAGEVSGEEATATHTLTLGFRSCPQGTDFDTDRNQLAEMCPAELEERSFLLTLDGVSIGETLSGSTSTWEFRSSTVQIDIGTGTTGKVACVSDWTEGAAGDARTPAFSFLDNGLLTIDVPQAVSTISCNWFIFPE